MCESISRTIAMRRGVSGSFSKFLVMLLSAADRGLNGPTSPAEGKLPVQYGVRLSSESSSFQSPINGFGTTGKAEK